MKQKLSSYLILFAILLFAAALRLYNLNWDQGNHLHPDERFLTMVATDMKLPITFLDYLTPQTSSFNPTNIGHTFFVYGAFPVILNKLLALAFSYDNYRDLTLQGRLLSGFADLFVVLLVFKTLLLFEKKYQFNQQVKYWGALFYAVSVLPIQLAHFFAVDTFLNCFLFAAFYFLIRFSLQKKLLTLLLSAVFLGLALASKISAIFMVPLFFFIVLPPVRRFHHKTLRKPLLLCLAFVVVCYVTLRLTDPYLFQNQNFFDLRPNTLFLQNLHTLQGFNNPDAWFPPGVQWIHKTPVLFSLQNIAFFGLGLPLFFFVATGMGIIVHRYRKTKLFGILLWCLLFFLYQSTQMTKTMRYFLVLYPFLALFAALGFFTITQKWQRFFIALAVMIILILPASFLGIYTKPHSRVQASTWINDTIPYGSTILVEHWDDALPLSTETKTFLIKELPVFGPDNPEKWRQMRTLLTQGDYLILSSNRGWGSIPTVPERYPLMTQFYKDLFADKLDYKKIATFTSYPSLHYLGIPMTFPDDWAEEAFTVYDHPKVMIFHNTAKNPIH